MTGKPTVEDLGIEVASGVDLHMATAAGIPTVICNGLRAGALEAVLEGQREGTRFAAVHGASNSSPAHATDITKLVTTAAYGLNSQNLKVTTTWSPDNKPGSMVLVQVRYTFNFTIPFITLKPVNLTSTSQMMISY